MTADLLVVFAFIAAVAAFSWYVGTRPARADDHLDPLRRSARFGAVVLAVGAVVGAILVIADNL